MVLFSRWTRRLAKLALVVGLSKLCLGIIIAGELLLPYEQALARYSTATSSGELIDRAIFIIVLALAVGTLAEIATTVREGSTRNEV